MNFTDRLPFVKIFPTNNLLYYAYILRAKLHMQKFFTKILISEFRENFLPQKFLAILYTYIMGK